MSVLLRLLLPLAVVLTAAGCGRSPTPVAVAPALPAPPLDPAAADVVENPSAKAWTSHPLGTTVTQRTTTDSARTPGMTVTTIVYVLKEKTDTHVAVESQATTEYHGGRVERNPPALGRMPKLIQLPDGVKKEDWGNPKGKHGGGEEVIEVLGKKYPCKWHKSSATTDAGALTSTTWMSADMPGGLVKAVSLVPAVEETTTIEVTALTIPGR